MWLELCTSAADLQANASAADLSEIRCLGAAAQMFGSRLNYVNLLLGAWGPRKLNQLKGLAVGPYNN